jgi:diamine N-acetyltransferase
MTERLNKSGSGGRDDRRAGELKGDRVVLRPASRADQRLVYDWLARSDSSRAMHGLPTYPEKPLPAWEDFCDAQSHHYFDDSALEQGRCYLILAHGEAVGQVTYNDINQKDGRTRTELDIWMRSEKDCGQGLGCDAMLTLCHHLSRQFGVQDFMVQPSARNPRAIRAYEKLGFKPLCLPIEEARAMWGPSDYCDSVYMVRTRD